MDRPRWLDDEIEIRQLLHWFIDVLDRPRQNARKKSLTRTVNKKNLPALFRNNQQSDHEWGMLKSLAGEYHLFEIRDARKRGPYEAEFANTTLVFNPQAEAMLRDWLQRPRQLPYRRQWRDAVAKYAGHFSDRGASLAGRPARITGKTAEQIVAGFAELASVIQHGLSLRQMSARCFWGQSKFLDAREELVTRLFDDVNIRPRPVVVNICLPRDIRGVLFIENQDSYINAMPVSGVAPQALDFSRLALVYLSGFQVSAARIREPAGVSLHFHAASQAEEKTRFEDWWFDRNEQAWQTFFWGDLDFSGMAILKALRRRFTHTEAWQPGYRAMLDQIRAGRGHDAGLAGKEEQSDPVQTGCHYADRELLPALRQSGLFMDQEWV